MKDLYFMRIIKRISVILILIVLNFKSNAQERTHQFRYRSGIDLDGSYKRLKGNLSLQWRFDDSGTFTNYNTELGLNYKINKFLYSGIDYRFRTTHFSDYHRLGVYMLLKKKIDSFTIKSRYLYQDHYFGQNTSNRFLNSSLRASLESDYKIRKGLKMGIGIEFFYALNNLNQQPLFYRFNLNIEKNISKNHALNLNYLQEVKSIQSTHSISISYNFHIF